MKKLAVLFFALVLCASMSTAAFASYALLENEDDWGGFSVLLDEKSNLQTDDIDLEEIEPGSEFWFYPTFQGKAEAFTDLAKPGDENSFGFDTDKLSSSEEKKVLEPVKEEKVYLFRSLGDIKLRTRIEKGKEVIRDVEFLEDEKFGGAEDVAGIRLRLVERLKSTDDDGVDFEVIVFPNVDGDIWDYDDKGMLIYGTVMNDFNDIDSESEYIDLYNNVVAVADEKISEIEYGLGPKDSDNMLSVHGRAANGASYWGYATHETTDAQDELMSEHDIDLVYNLDYIGLDKVAEHVIIDVDEDAYVYDEDLRLLGRGDDELPFEKVYYVSYNEIEGDSWDDWEDENEDEPEPEPDDDDFDLEDPTDYRVSYGAPEGPFENPSTGC